MSGAGIATRPASPTEGQAGARLIYLSGPATFDYALGLSAGAAQRLLAELWPLPDHLFSCRWAQVAVAGGAVQGLLLAYPGRALLCAGWATARLFRRRFPPRQLLTMARRAWRVERHSARVPRGDYYIAHLAVLPPARRQGIGSRLLALAESLAPAAGCRRCALDVYAGNDPARALYEHHGYLVERTATDASLAAISGHPAVLRMVKPLNPTSP